MTKTTIANRAIKALAGASPSRIQTNIQHSQAIVDQAIVANNIVHLAPNQELDIDKLPSGQISIPLELWLKNKEAIRARGDKIVVQIAADEDPADLRSDLDEVDMIVLPFVSHVDGRGYSHALILRNRYAYKGEIRAIGDVKFDQLRFLTRVGCNAFELHEELPDGENLESALSAFNELREVYQPSTDDARLIFSRRRAVH